jgi:hypothetical protein
MGGNPFYNLWLDEVAAVQVFVRLLANPTSIFALLLAAGSPCFFYYHRIGGDPMSANLNWAVVSIAVVFPLTMSLNEGKCTTSNSTPNATHLTLKPSDKNNTAPPTLTSAKLSNGGNEQ